ncbi:MAG TPA: TetR/AcrR family transcriptional regulator [Rhizomicrobium sp.]|nr:TetR/AcrR family transcriptional regulator [Rhizomicrobium sp.]
MNATQRKPAAKARDVAPKRGRGRPSGRGERVGHILDESLKCFAERGFERVTYDDLIARSKVSRGSFYWHFPSKEALYDAVLDYCVFGYAERLEEEFARTNPKDNIVKRLLDTALADFNRNRTQYRLLLRPPPSRGAVEKMARWNEDDTAFLRSKLEPAVKEGRLDRAAAEILPDVLSAFIDGVCVRLVLDDENSVSRLSKNIEAFLSRIVA